jgi:glutamine amidotransferase
MVSSRPEDVQTADRVILPGVGAFSDCMRGLSEIAGMAEALDETVCGNARPFLGICVGMQLMAERGLEHGGGDGLGWINGEVRQIEPVAQSLKIPHMGWNTVNIVNEHPLWDGIETGDDGLHAYFVHSYHFVASDKTCVSATTNYGGPVTAMVARDNMAGVQFHPEKSQKLGLRLLANFICWQP